MKKAIWFLMGMMAGLVLWSHASSFGIFYDPSSIAAQLKQQVELRLLFTSILNTPESRYYAIGYNDGMTETIGLLERNGFVLHDTTSTQPPTETSP